MSSIAYDQIKRHLDAFYEREYRKDENFWVRCHKIYEYRKTMLDSIHHCRHCERDHYGDCEKRNRNVVKGRRGKGRNKPERSRFIRI